MIHLCRKALGATVAKALCRRSLPIPWANAPAIGGRGRHKSSARMLFCVSKRVAVHTRKRYPVIKMIYSELKVVQCEPTKLVLYWKRISRRNYAAKCTFVPQTFKHHMVNSSTFFFFLLFLISST